jgi:sterol desaturase/sphingolipid hydroxylase (fatty acid hydroxylase superfamily)
MTQEKAVRFGFFLFIFLLVAIWEFLAPRRQLTTSKVRRWLRNLTITVVNPALVHAIFPVLAVSMALKAQESEWGLMHAFEFPYWMAFALSIAALDFIIYLQHLMFHAVPLLWRLHMVHHADMNIDVTTGLRFHPVEILISMLIKLSAVAVIGPPVAAVVTFEVILNGMAMFNHGNIRLPLGIDRLLRLLVVTPDMHRVHHSIYPRETNTNFGFNLSWWDRLFGTYKAQPMDGHDGMTIGLRQYQDESKVTLPRILLMPFVGDIGKYAIGKRG